MGQPWIAPDTPAESRSPAVARAVAVAAARPRPPGPLRGSPVDRIRPRRTLEVLDAGFEVLRFRFGVIAALTATIVGPLVGVPLVARNLGLTDRFDGYTKVTAELGIGSATNSSFALTVLGWLCPALALALLGVGVGRLVGAWLVGEDPTYREVLRVVLRRAPVITAAWFIALPVKAIGFVLCWVGALVTVGMFVVLSPVVANEAVGPFRAVGRSYRLSGGRRAIGMAAFVLTSLIVQQTFQLVTGLVAVFVSQQVLSDPSWSWVVVTGSTLAFSMVLMPVQAAWGALAYVELRVRAEGLDVQLDAARVLPAGEVGGAG